MIRRVVAKFLGLSAPAKVACGAAAVAGVVGVGGLWYVVSWDAALGGAAAGLAAAWGWFRGRSRTTDTALDLARERAERDARDAEDSRRTAELAGRRRIEAYHQDALRRAEADAARLHPRDVLDSVTRKK